MAASRLSRDLSNSGRWRWSGFLPREISCPKGAEARRAEGHDRAVSW